MRRVIMIVVVALTTAVQAAGSENWPQFRGPGGQGHADAENLPLTWGPDENVAWKQEVPGEGWSSPVYYQGTVYVTAAIPIADNPDGDLRLSMLAFDADTGKQTLDVSVFEQDGAKAPKIHRKNSHASPTPIAADGRIFVHFGHQGTACLDTNGKVLWKNRELSYPPVHGNGGSPALADDKLIFSCDGGRDPFVVALDAATGKVVWKTDRETKATKKFSFSTPLVIDVAGRKQIISPGSDTVCSYDIETGEEIWRVRYTGYSVIPRPVFAHGLLFISTSYDAPSVLAVRPDGSGDVTDTHVVWTLKRGAPHTPSMLVVGDELYMVSDRGIASCVDAKTGEVHWLERIGGAFSASPVFADGKIYLQSEEGVGHVLAPGKEFVELARNDLKERTLASIAIAENAIFLRSAVGLYRIQRE